MSNEVVALRLSAGKVVRLEHYESEQRTELPVRHQQAHLEFARVSEEYPNAYLAWYDDQLSAFLADISTWPQLLRHPMEVLHLSCFQRCDLMVESLGFVDHDSPFLLAGATDRRYPTWLISPMCGMGHAATFRAGGFDPRLGSFSAAIMEFGLRAMQCGLCPYSEPRLLAREVPTQLLRALGEPSPAKDIARLIKRGYGRQWLFFWFACNLLFKHAFPLLSLVKGLATNAPKSRNCGKAEQARLRPRLPDELPAHATIDAVIPTLNRPAHLANLLHDLSTQSVVPRRVIIIEQTANGAPASELTDLAEHTWPFELKLHLVPWIGACKARNLGLSESQAEWVLLLDDDVRLPVGLSSYLLSVAQAYCVGAITAAVYLPHQEPAQLIGSPFPRVWPSFGTCASLVSRRAIEASGGFDEHLEHGYGEDYEFGVRLRLSGTNVLYAPGVPVLHLKAPSGGFRHKFAQPWESEKVQPRPSPTVLLSRRKHVTRVMQQGYMLYYWAKRLAYTPAYRWPREIVTLTRQWRNSVKWAGWLALR